MQKTFGKNEKMKAAEAVSRLIDESSVPTKIEIVKSEQVLAVSSFGLTMEDEKDVFTTKSIRLWK